MSSSLYQKWFCDENGKRVLWQPPNTALIAGFAAALFSDIADGRLASMFFVLSFGTFFAWAWMEIFSGANYFRRTLGFTVLVFIVIMATFYGRVE